MSHSCHTSCSLREDRTGSRAHQPGEAVLHRLLGAGGAANGATNAALYSSLLHPQVCAHVDRKAGILWGITQVHSCLSDRSHSVKTSNLCESSKISDCPV